MLRISKISTTTSPSTTRPASDIPRKGGCQLGALPLLMPQLNPAALPENPKSPPRNPLFGKIRVFPGIRPARFLEKSAFFSEPGQLTRTRTPPALERVSPVSGTRVATKPNGTVKLLLTMTVVEENPVLGESTREIDLTRGIDPDLPGGLSTAC